MSGDDSVIPTSKVVMEMQFDLIRNCVEGEEPPSEDQKKESADVLSLWIRYITGKIRIQVTEKEYDTLGLVRHSHWFKQLEYHIILVSSANVNETRKDLFKSLVHSIGYEIFRFTKILCDLKVIMNPETFILYIKNVKLTLKNTIDFENTALFLIENTNLRTEYKYVLACYFCLEKQVRELVKELPPQYFEAFVDSSNEVLNLLLVWYYCVTNQKHSLNELIVRRRSRLIRSNDEFFMSWAIHNENELAVQYVYEKICKISCHNIIFGFALCALNFKSTNILCYLLSKLPSEQIKRVCIYNGYAVLSMLATNSRWSDYFMPTSDYVLKYFDEMPFPCGIKTLIRCWIVNESRRNSYGEYLDSFASKHKVYIDKHLLHTRNKSILNVIFGLKGMKSIVPMLKLGNVLEFDNFCRDDDVMRNIGLELIIGNKISLLEELISDVYPEVEEKRLFKNYLFEIIHFKVFSELIKMDKYKELDEILKYFYEENENYILNIRENIPFKEGGQIIARVFEIEDATVWDVMNMADRILNWSFNGDRRRFDVWKYELLNPFIDPISYCMKQFLFLICKLMMKKGGESVRILLNWANPRHDSEWGENVMFIATLLARKRNEGRDI